MFGNLLKAVVGVVVLPLAAAVDVVMLPDSAMDFSGKTKAFGRTEKVAKSIGKNVTEALEP